MYCTMIFGVHAATLILSTPSLVNFVKYPESSTFFNVMLCLTSSTNWRETCFNEAKI
jgi:hypothetical protein